MFPPRSGHQKGVNVGPGGRTLKTAERAAPDEVRDEVESLPGRHAGSDPDVDPFKEGGSSPRRISTGALNPLQGVQGRPINVVLFHAPYPVDLVRGLILGRASRLDAFSAYPFPT